MLGIDVEKSLKIEDQINSGRIADGEETAEEVEAARPTNLPGESDSSAVQASAAGDTGR
jgi:hypothetical protein